MSDRVILTVAVPEADRVDASHLAVCLGWREGYHPAEWELAFSVPYYDADGNTYRVMSCPVRETFVAATTMMGPVERPADDVEPYIVDLDAARRAQAKLVVTLAPDAVPVADQTGIFAVVGPPGRQVVQDLGLLKDMPEIEEEEEEELI